jgi:hypothetical protein
LLKNCRASPNIAQSIGAIISRDMLDDTTRLFCRTTWTMRMTCFKWGDFMPKSVFKRHM